MHFRHRQTDRQTDMTSYSINVRSLKMKNWSSYV